MYKNLVLVDGEIMPAEEAAVGTSLATVYLR